MARNHKRKGLRYPERSCRLWPRLDSGKPHKSVALASPTKHSWLVSVDRQTHRAIAIASSIHGRPLRSRTWLQIPSSLSDNFSPCPHTTYWGWWSQLNTHVKLLDEPRRIHWHSSAHP